MLAAGKRTNRVRFDVRVAGADDGFGNTVPEAWSFGVAIWAAFRPKFASEQLAAGRLESGLQGTLTVLRWPLTEAVTASHRVVFISGAYAGKIMQIRSVLPGPDRREIEMLLEEGGAV